MSRPPRILRALFARLLPGDVGAEACAELESDWARTRARRGAFVASALYAVHLLRPSTWALARALKRRTAGAAALPVERASGIRISWLDVKLGLRMLVKHPGLTLVSGLAMSVTVAIAIGTFSAFRDSLLRPIVPLPDGERIVSLGLRYTQRGGSERRLLHDFAVWRDELETVEDASLWRQAPLNIIGPDGRSELVSFAVTTASGFRVARVPPLHGRPLLDSDEVPGAPGVLVIGYDEWHRRYLGDPDVVGRTIQIGREQHTIVGIMPEGFRFPLAEQRWIPLRDDPDDYPVGEAPWRYWAFGRLAPGATLASAQAELGAITNRRNEEFGETAARVRGLVMSYTDDHTGLDGGSVMFVRAILGLITMLVLIPFVNVALLVYARTATRSGEIAVRTALGASRRRVVAQLFSEALVLSALSAAAGVALVTFALNRVNLFMEVYLGGSLMPFWAKAGRDPWVVAYAVGLTVLAALVAGAIPGLKATGRHVQANLANAATGNGMRLGRVWTGLVVAQVAITVAFLPLAATIAWQMVDASFSTPSFAGHEYLGAHIAAPGGAEARRAGAVDGDEAIEEVLRRVAADSRVARVTLSTQHPGEVFSAGAIVDIEGLEPPVAGRAPEVGGASWVDPDLFETLGVPVTAGRGFTPADTVAEVDPVIVNDAFVRDVLGGANAVGRRLRMSRDPRLEPAPWQEIVGVVPDLVLSRGNLESSRMYMPLDRSRIADGVVVVAHVPSGAAEFAPELRRITTQVDPTLQLGRAMPLGDPADPQRLLMRAFAIVVALVIGSVLLLSTAGIFALMSFNVTQRRREIGIRSALGAHPRRVLLNVMARSFKQLGAGVAVGCIVVAAIPRIDLDGLIVGRDFRAIAAVSLLMVVVGLIAAAGPTRRGLSIQPTEALRDN